MSTQQRRSEEHQQTIRRRKTRRGRVPSNAGLGKKLFLTAVIVAAVVCSLMLFFKVRKIEVGGNLVYDNAAIIEASGVHTGDNLLFVNKSAVAGRISTLLPYVQEVQVTRLLPGTVRLDVTETDAPFGAQADDGTVWLLDSAGKALEQLDSDATDGYPMLLGFTIQPAKVGAAAQSEEGADSLDAAIRVMTALRGTGLLPQIASIDVAKPYDIVLQYADRFKVWLGGTDQLEYKFQYLTAVLEQLDSYQTGTIDLTFDEEKVARFIPT